MKRLRGEAGQELRYDLIREGLGKSAKWHDGDVLLVPSAEVVAEAISKTRGFIYGNPDGLSYEETLERATGLIVIHKGGIVLARDTHGSSETPIEKLEALTSTMSTKEVAALIGRLAFNITNC